MTEPPAAPPAGAPEPDDPQPPIEDASEPFNPYRFGLPDHPIPPEYAPPGYVAPPQPGPTDPGQRPFGPGYGGTPVPPYQQGSAYPPPYGEQPQYGYQPQRRNARATWAVVCGAISIVLCFLTIFDAIPIVLAIVFGLLALGEAKRLGGTGRGLAITGIALALVGAVLAIVLSVLAVRAIDKCGGIDQRDDPGFNQCIRDHFG